ncbi:DUF1453 family protein [Paenibacillus taichungensis]|uniref:DUF1453 family protein n=1 Tax=Paenibacillus taichungensis TaxID=484184 RepID=A0ABX2MMN7_9BACL|nr:MULTISPECIES: DUF1453 family protein [Paenibacillus]NUU55280.1 DUF1453 family protein [Paenibacillus taichungensis]PIH56459.1 hypothetical protein CS562_26585 [Paenibacillus sp. LK1]
MTTSMWVQMIIMFAVLVLTSIGRKPVRYYRLLLPFVIMGYYAAKFLKDMTFTGNNVLFLLVAVIVGALFGIIVLGITRMEFDATAGKWYTRVGIGSVVVWGAAFLLRIIPVEWITHHPQQAYQYAIEHQLDLQNIGPAFIFMTAAMVLVRVAGILFRSRVSKVQHTIGT